ncbi:hypothetical protein EYZ11_002983 [Aspergillus tanneri]|uniref:Antifungal protein n=1 Tax=Aspergillus tanneri TaxID=1220188 RepID=A0A4S3JQ44_9EURO|nr:hypothetical protein EYZ11_002983 [Aspergillus tanneri]
MKVATLASLGFAFSAALGASTSPDNRESLTSNGLDVRNENKVEIEYPGYCNPDTNQCHYETQNGLKAICRCSSKKCTNNIENKSCYYEPYSKACVCQNVNGSG